MSRVLVLVLALALGACAGSPGARPRHAVAGPESTGAPPDAAIDARPAIAPPPRTVNAGELLAARPLVARCTLAALLAQQLLDVMEWQRDFERFIASDTARLIVFLDHEGHHKLIADDEACAPTDARLVTSSRRVRVLHAGREERTDSFYMLLWLVPASTSAHHLVFEWPRSRDGYQGNPPAVPGVPHVSIGVPQRASPAPRIWFEIDLVDDTFVTVRAVVESFRRSLAVPP